MKQKETVRHRGKNRKKQEETGKDRKKTGRNRKKQEETGRDRKRQEETGRHTIHGRIDTRVRGGRKDSHRVNRKLSVH